MEKSIEKILEECKKKYPIGTRCKSLVNPSDRFVVNTVPVIERKSNGCFIISIQDTKNRDRILYNNNFEKETFATIVSYRIKIGDNVTYNNVQGKVIEHNKMEGEYLVEYKYKLHIWHTPDELTKIKS